jgi:hypothetical protein
VFGPLCASQSAKLGAGSANDEAAMAQVAKVREFISDAPLVVDERFLRAL